MNYQFIYNVLPDRPYAPCDMGNTDVWEKLQQDAKFLSDIHHKLYLQNPRPIIEIYDLINDPFQLNNLWGNPEIKETEKMLRQKLDKWIIREGDFVPIMDELKEFGGGKRGIQD